MLTHLVINVQSFRNIRLGNCETRDARLQP